jgi:CDP-diacylglycerol--glycerol-3-phosphate 3-phosphatidyltransferase
MNRFKCGIVWSMVLLRVVLCPVMVWGAKAGWGGTLLAAIVLIALVDDIYDGVMARRWGCDTLRVRLWDSLADTVFYLGVAMALWIREPEVLRRNWVLLAILFLLEAARYAFDLYKYGKAASYHSYMAKAWGLLLAASMVGVFALRGLQVLVTIAAAWGIAVNLEGLTMSLMLPEWKNDVKTLPRAWALRKSLLSESATEASLR